MGWTWKDRFTNWWDMTWTCRVRRRHLVKMGSRPFCYRCGRLPNGGRS